MEKYPQCANLSNLVCDLVIIFECTLPGEAGGMIVKDPSPLEVVRELCGRWYEGMSLDSRPTIGSFKGFAAEWNKSIPMIEMLNATRSQPIARALLSIACDAIENVEKSQERTLPFDDDYVEGILKSEKGKLYLTWAMEDKDPEYKLMGLCIHPRNYPGPAGKLFEKPTE